MKLKKVRIDISKYSNYLVYEAFQESITNDYSKLKWDLSSVEYNNRKEKLSEKYVYDYLIKYYNYNRTSLPLSVYDTEVDLKNVVGMITRVKKYKNFLTLDIKLLNTYRAKKYDNDKKIGLNILFIKKPIKLELTDFNGFKRITSDDKTVSFFIITINKTGINKIKIYENN